MRGIRAYAAKGDSKAYIYEPFSASKVLFRVSRKLARGLFVEDGLTATKADFCFRTLGLPNAMAGTLVRHA